MLKRSVSVVIPVYNEERYLDRCLTALQKQTLKPDEIIIVDNNSTDTSSEIAKRYGATVITEMTQGIMPARSRGYDAAKSDIIARIDADTIVEPDWLERMAAAFDNDSVVAVSGATNFYETRLPALAHWLFKVFYFEWNRTICGVSPLFGSDMAFLRSAWSPIRAQQHIHINIWEDLDFSLSINGDKRQLNEPKCAVSMRSANDSLWGVIRYMWRWPMTYYYRRHWRGFISSLIGLSCLAIFAPIVLVTSRRR